MAISVLIIHQQFPTVLGDDPAMHESIIHDFGSGSQYKIYVNKSIGNP